MKGLFEFIAVIPAPRIKKNKFKIFEKKKKKKKKKKRFFFFFFLILEDL